MKIYDEETRKLEVKLTAESSVIPGHTNRVFCGKYNPEDSNIIVTGGWDQKCLVWDLRERNPVRTFSGPLICGDGIDIFEDEILTASWKDKDQLQNWDLGTGKLISTIKWDDGYKPSPEQTFLYSGMFSKMDGSLILAGGSGSNEARVFDRQMIDKNVCVIYDLSREVNTVDWGNKFDKFALGGSDGYIRIFKMNVQA